MSIPTKWYLDPAQSDLNSGGSTGAAALTTAALVVVGTGGTIAAGGLNALGSNALGINIQVGGNSEIRGYTVNSDTTLTLDAAPSAGDGTYAAKIGGARVSLTKSARNGTNQNAKVAAGNSFTLAAGTYTETDIIMQLSNFIRGVATAILDGTGGAAGSDILSEATSQSTDISNLTIQNAVDRGWTTNQAATFHRVKFLNCGGIGCAHTSTITVEYCVARGCGAQGFSQLANGPVAFTNCEAGDNVSTGFNFPRGCNVFTRCIAYDNGSSGAIIGSDVAQQRRVSNCTFEGNTGHGMSWTGTIGVTVAYFVVNCNFSNNSTSGFTSSTDISAFETLDLDYNNYYGNGAARSGVPTGTNDIAVDPKFVNASGDDYTLDTGSGLILAGWPGWKSPNKQSIGATEAEVAVVGGSPLIGGGLVR